MRVEQRAASCIPKTSIRSACASTRAPLHDANDELLRMCETNLFGAAELGRVKEADGVEVRGDGYTPGGRDGVERVVGRAEERGHLRELVEGWLAGGGGEVWAELSVGAEKEVKRRKREANGGRWRARRRPPTGSMTMTREAGPAYWDSLLSGRAVLNTVHLSLAGD